MHLSLLGEEKKSLARANQDNREESPQIRRFVGCVDGWVGGFTSHLRAVEVKYICWLCYWIESWGFALLSPFSAYKNY